MTTAASFPLPLPIRWGSLVAASDRDAQGARSDVAGPAVRRAAAAEDREWVRLARGGDGDAFRRLVERHGDAVFETALRIVRSREEAEEAAQDAFIRAWRSLDGFREEALFSTWLYRIVTRCALDASARLERRRGRETAETPDVIERAAAPDRPELDRRRLDRALARLTPVQRAVVTLFYLRDQPVSEVAAALDLPAGTVKTHLHRARAALRRSWTAGAAGAPRPGGAS